MALLTNLAPRRPAGAGALLRLACALVVLGTAACAGDTTDSVEDASEAPASSVVTASPSTVQTTTPTTIPTITTAPASTVPTTLSRNAPPARVEFTDAVARGILSITVRGRSLTSLQLSITSSAAENLLVTIQPATLFESQSRGVQNMVATAPEEVRISPGESANRTIDAACANMLLTTPGPANNFVVSGLHSEDMAKLVKVAGFPSLPFRTRQFAVWVVTDNPSRSGFTGLSGSDGSGPPTDTEIAAIRELFVTAGIAPSSYRALR